MPEVLALFFLAAWAGRAAWAESAELPSSSETPSQRPRRNSCPVILVHGVLGYGQDLSLPISAWGGLEDYCRSFREEGFPVFSATVGPASSNWDRACELFAFIGGGRVDYGAAHSARCGHARFGRVYSGVCPDWGEGRKVSLLCHSMGGQTARLLVQLLEEGDPDERAEPSGAESPLFQGGHRWVLAVMTFCSPHDGTSLTMAVDFESRAATQAICAALAAVNPPFDLMLDQWGLARRPGESAPEYAGRLASDPTWYLGDDSCYRDLRPSGAARLNARVPASDDVYYFSWAASTTYAFGAAQLPSWTTQAFLAAGALAMGGFAGADGPWPVDGRWRESDGVVNTVSMDGPKLGSSDLILPFSGAPRRGAWNFMGALAETDHMDLLGLVTPPWYAPAGFASCKAWYRYNLELLASLED